MRTTLLLSKASLSKAAAVVLISGGVAAAQEMKKDEHPARAPAAQQHAPAEKIAPTITQGARKAPETTGQGATSPDTERNAAPHATDSVTAPNVRSNEKSERKGGINASENKTPSGKTETRSTTGQGAAAGAAKLSTEQRTKISTIIRQQKVAPAHLNVPVSVGTRVPPSVRLYPLPVEVINIYPEWRGYDYVMIRDEILVIDPGTHEIVAIIEA